MNFKMKESDTSYKCSKIATSVEFLRDVNAKGYSEAVLRNYLIEKRGLSAEEVEVAFMINRNRLEADAREKKETQEKQPPKGNASGRADRPEKPTSFTKRDQIQDVSFLVVNQQTKGQQLINRFLDNERSYCSTLQCLKQYYDQLLNFASEGKFQMTRKEINGIFIRIPTLLSFHKGFFLDIKRGSNIGRMFVRLFKFFGGYAEYMKDCEKTVKKMRKYIRDARLFQCTSMISKRTLRKEELADLLLIPLNRMAEYKTFLDKLLSWADPSQTSDYELLGKASRRIGRVATHIDKYKHGIFNQNEMNKVQRFLSDQCDILSPDRSIVRRGMMTRHTSSWVSRKKQYVFFLFNDMLLWTNKNGRLRNALQLRSCEVMPSSSKKLAHRKFDVVCRGQRHKTLLLETDKVFEREEWFNAMKSTIARAKQISSQAWSRSDPLNNAKYQDYEKELSDEESKNQEVSLNETGQDEESRVEQSELLDDPYNRRYGVTSSFKIQEFSEIESMDDNLSQISEHDSAFFREHGGFIGENSPTSAILSPFETRKQARRTSDSLVNGSDSGTSIYRNNRKLMTSTNCGNQDGKSKEESFEFFNQKPKKYSIIRRTSSYNESQAVESSQFTLRLNNI